MQLSNWQAALVTLFAALIWLRLNNFTAARGWISAQDSRKLIHIGTGPIFVCCWLLFPLDSSSRYWAAAVPFLITIQFILVGLEIIKDESAVKSMSRTGNPRELLRGPLLYGLAFVVITLAYWLDSVIGIVGLMILCGGDGLADIVGRRWGNSKLPWSPAKSWVGSLGMLGGGYILAAAIPFILDRSGVLQLDYPQFLMPLFLVCIATSLVESFPIRDLDNLTIPLTAILISSLLPA